MLSFDTRPQLGTTCRLGDLHLPHIAPTGLSALNTRTSDLLLTFFFENLRRVFS